MIELTTAVGLVAGSLILAALVAGYWPDQPPAGLRWLLFVVLWGTWLAAAAQLTVRMLTWRQSHAETARLVEQAKPEFKNNLINSVLLSQDADQRGPELVQRAIDETLWQLRRADLRDSISTRPLARRGMAAGAAVLLLAALLVIQPHALMRGLRATLWPTRYVPHHNQIELLSLEPGDTTVFAGQSLNVRLTIRNEQGESLAAQVLIDGRKPRPMAAQDEFSRFTCALGQVDLGFRYAVRAGDCRWPADRPYYTVTVLRRVEVEALELRYRYPPYTGLKDKVVSNADGPIEAPQGTRARVTARLRQPVPHVLLDRRGTARQPMHGQLDNKAFSAEVPVDSDGAYRLLLKDPAGRTIQQLPDLREETATRLNEGAPDSAYYPIHAVPDEPPKIMFLAPQGDACVAPGGTLRTHLRVSDDYGLTAVRLIAGKEGGPSRVAHDYALKPGARRGEFEFDLPLAAWTEGDVVVCYATATDNRSLTGGVGPQTRATPPFKITIERPGKTAAEKAKRIEELRRRLQAILRMQETQRVNTALCWKKHVTIEQVAQTATEIVKGQTEVRSALLHLVKHFRFDQDTLLVRQTVDALARSEAATAVEQAKVLAALADMKDRSRSCSALADTQDRILRSLQCLLGILPSLARQADPKSRGRPGEDLPPDVRAKLAQLKEDLKKFLEEQRKVIEASQDLAKKPVDNFQPDEQQTLQELVRTEDKWEKFLEEAFQDLSKLMEQDFSQPALLKELASVKSDITMAKDALSKKAVEIATALEDNAAHGAEEILHNMEKWLPDEPDRAKWVMEDPTDQTNVEMPELPDALVDIMGDLLEQEEDLFEEMQDVTSKYGTSADAGWDAMDGPISSMNADGVTGNQLPNTSEISGRSGEGRQGKSSGEFVQDQAVGKGGRRTPTRLTPDAFQAGQVDDKSGDPPGGATGGGKVSGAGQEGLEGPVPPGLANEMERLAGKQAQILNRTERIRQQFTISDYANFRLLQAVTLMSRVKRDLQSHRYQNVLRARNATIDSLMQARDLVSGRAEVEADRSSALPKHIRQGIADTRKGKLPEEYREALEAYFRRLNETAQR